MIPQQGTSYNGVGRIRTGGLQRPRLASYQARQRPLILQLNNNFYYIILSFGSFLLNYCSFKIRLKNHAVMTSTIFSIGIMVCSDWATVIPLPSIKTGYA